MTTYSASYLHGVRDERNRVIALLRGLREEAVRKWQGDGVTRGTHATYEEAVVDTLDAVDVAVALAKP